jgi:alkanesulfonate monooxygenase SsuD/methylene tetrahydromethanopterin reductase-like flavin-dependent oxidoreductase (luciferase family)
VSKREEGVARHPWVAEADLGVRFGVLLTGARGVTTPTGPEHGWLMHDEPLQEILSSAQIAEDSGLDAVFVPDTPRLFPDPIVALSALATTTEKIEIGSLVIVAPFRHPALLARMIADVDRLSGGRVVLGLGIGEAARQYATIDAPWGSVAERRERLGEAIQLMDHVWKGAPIRHSGRYYRAEDILVAPGPAQKPRPPFLIAGSGDGTLRQVAQLADACNLFGDPAHVGERFERLGNFCDDAERPQDEILRSYYDFPVLASTEAEANAKLRQVMSDDVIASRGARGLIVAGTPEQAIEHYRGLAKAGVQYFTANLADTADHETLKLLANVVVPGVKGN